MNKGVNSNQTCMERFLAFDRLKKLLDLDDLDPTSKLIDGWVRKHAFSLNTFFQAFVCYTCSSLDYGRTCCKFRNFCEGFIFPNSVKRHICDVINSQLGHDLPTSVNG